MNRIDQIFSQLRESRRKALMPFVCADYPRRGSLAGVIEAVAGAGASIIEIGIPFSDPIADGPVIAAAMHEALIQGSTPLGVFEQVHHVRNRTNVGLIAMVSVSIVHRMGADRFIEAARETGFDGFIFPDAPLEEAGELARRTGEAGMTASLLIAPTTSRERAARIAALSTGFIYLLARSGITGERDQAPDVGRRVSQLREVTDLPIACGFGISTPEHVRAVVAHAEAAIVGSALVRRMGEVQARNSDVASEAGAFVRELARGCEATPERVDG